MNRLLVPAIIGILAAFTHYTYLSSKVRLSEYIVVKKPVRIGEEIRPDAIETIQLPGDQTRLSKAFVPYSEKHNVIMAIAQRDLYPEDVLFWQDTWRDRDDSRGLRAGEMLVPIELNGIVVETKMLMPGKQIWFQISSEPKDEQSRKIQGKLSMMGPYRIVAVGAQKEKQVHGEDEKEADSRLRGSERTITIPLKFQTDGNPDEKSSQIMIADKEKRIVRIVFEPSNPSVRPVDKGDVVEDDTGVETAD
jgi:hypothetical protein